MKNFVMNLAVIGLLVFTVGCAAVGYSYNQQRATARSGGDMGMTAIVDQLDPTSKEQLESYALFLDEILILLDSGKVGVMTQAQLTTELNKIVPLKYQVYTVSLTAILGGLNIPVNSVLPQKAIVLMKDFVNGSKTAVNQYTVGMNAKTETK